MLHDADVVLAVQAPDVDVVDAMKPGSMLICFVYAGKEAALVQRLVDRKITCFAMERLPRISRAQAMDALSSQSALAGYYAVQLGSTHIGRILPKVTTAAGAIGPARVLVMGLGVAGLEAIATAHRLGAVVEGYDVRPETAEQARSLGATFVETGVDARGDGGYARALTADEQAQGGHRAHAAHLAQADLVITTAAIPGKAVAQADQQGAGRRHEGGRRDRRPVRRRRRQLRGHATGRDRAGGRRHDRRAAERAVAARAPTRASCTRRTSSTCSR